MVEISPRGVGAAGFVYLSRGNPFEVDVAFDYKGKPQVLTFQLSMRHGYFGSEHDCGSPTSPIDGAADWLRNAGTFSYIVPSTVEDGGQDIRLHITTPDGKEEYSGWLTDCIWI